MILRKFVKKILDLDESTEVKKLQSRVEWYRNGCNDLENERDKWKGQANVDATENIVLKAKLKKIRDLLGKDDEVFSKFSRDQIEDMSIEEFREVESEIDKDVAGGKLFLQ